MKIPSECFRLLSALQKAGFWYREAERFVARAVFDKFLPRVAPDQLSLLANLRIVAKVFLAIAALLTLAAIWEWSAKILNLAGLLFGGAGILRVFMDGEWERIIQLYTDEKAYPFGPPSYVTRELFADDDPETLGEISTQKIFSYITWSSVISTENPSTMTKEIVFL